MSNSSAITVMKKDKNAQQRAFAIRNRFIRMGHIDAMIEEREDRYIILKQKPKDEAHLSEAEKVRRSGRY